MQQKTSNVADTSVHLGLNIHRGKSKVLKFNAVTGTPNSLGGKTLNAVESFIYFGSIVDKKGGAEVVSPD